MISSLEVDVDYLLNGFSRRHCFSKGQFQQQIQGTVVLMVFDFLVLGWGGLELIFMKSEEGVLPRNLA